MVMRNAMPTLHGTSTGSGSYQKPLPLCSWVGRVSTNSRPVSFQYVLPAVIMAHWAGMLVGRTDGVQEGVTEAVGRGDASPYTNEMEKREVLVTRLSAMAEATTTYTHRRVRLGTTMRLELPQKLSLISVQLKPLDGQSFPMYMMVSSASYPGSTGPHVSTISCWPSGAVGPM